jgi:hypothetical protein
VLSEIVLRALKDRFIQVLLIILVATIYLRHMDHDLIMQGAQACWQLLMWIMD